MYLIGEELACFAMPHNRLGIFYGGWAVKSCSESFTDQGA
jgi:hypothetical protein